MYLDSGFQIFIHTSFFSHFCHISHFIIRHGFSPKSITVRRCEPSIRSTHSMHWGTSITSTLSLWWDTSMTSTSIPWWEWSTTLSLWWETFETITLSPRCEASITPTSQTCILSFIKGETENYYIMILCRWRLICVDAVYENLCFFKISHGPYFRFIVAFEIDLGIMKGVY